MPLAVLSRRQFAGFRTGAWSCSTDRVQAALARPWDLHLVKPSFFPLPACVVFGERVSDTAQGLTAPAETWSGRLPSRNATLAEALPALSRAAGTAVAPATAGSAYGPAGEEHRNGNWRQRRSCDGAGRKPDAAWRPTGPIARVAADAETSHLMRQRLQPGRIRSGPAFTLASVLVVGSAKRSLPGPDLGASGQS
jgi:hypothetical protein